MARPASNATTTPSLSDFDVGIICTLITELAAVEALLEEEFDNDILEDVDNNNMYTLGRMGQHYIIVACMPDDTDESISVISIAKHMRITFTRLRFCVSVGIGSGLPNPPEINIRLGDIAVGCPVNGSSALIQYGRTTNDAHLTFISSSNSFPTEVRGALTKIRAKHRRFGSRVPIILAEMLGQNAKMAKHGYSFPGRDKDPQQDYVDTVAIEDENERDSPKIHYGTIVATNQTVNHIAEREELRQKYGAICLETEAFGLDDSVPFLVVRGICDYADNQNFARWNSYAAAVAAAFVKELLTYIPVITRSIRDSASGQRSFLNSRGTSLHESIFTPSKEIPGPPVQPPTPELTPKPSHAPLNSTIKAVSVPGESKGLDKKLTLDTTSLLQHQDHISKENSQAEISLQPADQSPILSSHTHESDHHSRRQAGRSITESQSDRRPQAVSGKQSSFTPSTVNIEDLHAQMRCWDPIGTTKATILEPEFIPRNPIESANLYDTLSNMSPGLVQRKLSSGSPSGIAEIFKAIASGNETAVIDYFRCGGSVDAMLNDRDDRSLLYHAALHGKLRMCEILLDNKAQIETRCDTIQGETALHAAASHGHKKVVELLLRRGADIEAKCDGGYQCTPLYSAVIKGDIEMTELLLDRKAYIEARTGTDLRYTPLHAAATKGHTYVTELLVDRGAWIDAKTGDKRRNTPIYLAASLGHDNIVGLLLERGADTEVESATGFKTTALHAAASKGHEKVVRVFVDEGLEPDSLNSEGWTPVISAIKEGHDRVVQTLLSAGGLKGDTFWGLHWAVFYRQPAILQVLIHHGADVNAKLARNKYPGLNFTIMCKDDTPLTPLHIAVSKNQPQMVQLLLQNRANPNVGDLDKLNPPLQMAVWHGLEPIVKILLEGGADPNFLKMGKLLLQRARKQNQTEIERLLRQKGAKDKSRLGSLFTTAALAGGDAF